MSGDVLWVIYKKVGEHADGVRMFDEGLFELEWEAIRCCEELNAAERDKDTVYYCVEVDN